VQLLEGKPCELSALDNAVLLFNTLYFESHKCDTGVNKQEGVATVHTPFDWRKIGVRVSNWWAFTENITII
jgi:hypothetical protein